MVHHDDQYQHRTLSPKPGTINNVGLGMITSENSGSTAGIAYHKKSIRPSKCCIPLFHSQPYPKTLYRKPPVLCNFNVRSSYFEGFPRDPQGSSHESLSCWRLPFFALNGGCIFGTDCPLPLLFHVFIVLGNTEVPSQSL